MSLNVFFRYLGGGVALCGLATSLAFVGRRTAEPVATLLWDPLPLWLRLVGILSGLVVLAVGLAIVGRLGAPAESG